MLNKHNEIRERVVIQRKIKRPRETRRDKKLLILIKEKEREREREREKETFGDSVCLC